MLLSTGVCPKCQQGHNTPCYATYSDGGKCFSCGYSSKAWIPSAIDESASAKKEYILPKYTQSVHKFSVSALNFFSQYFITFDLLESYGIGYSEENNSVLYPLLPSYTQERFLEKKKFKTYGATPIYITHSADSNSIVLVEDFLSCIRVGEFLPTMCLFGTSLSSKALDRILHCYQHVIIWLDGDSPGQAAADKIQKQLINAFSRECKKYPFMPSVESVCKNICTEKDPKKYSYTQIKDILCIK